MGVSTGVYVVYTTRCLCALYVCTRHRCCTVQFTCTVLLRGVRVWGKFKYNDKVELRFTVTLIKLTKRWQIYLVLVFGKLACFMYVVVRYIMLLSILINRYTYRFKIFWFTLRFKVLHRTKNLQPLRWRLQPVQRICLIFREWLLVC